MIFLGFVLALTAFFTPTATPSGTLEFLSLEQWFTTVVLYGDDTYGVHSLVIPLQFGPSTVNSIYVSTNGYLSMGVVPSKDEVPNIPTSIADRVVAPFAADIDTTTSGTVRFTSFSTLSQSNQVNAFIRTQASDNEFSGDIILIAEWDQDSTNTFQGILVADLHSNTYAVFIYKCGGMGWGGGVIGWQATSTSYEVHQLSGDSDNNKIGCLYSSTYSAVLFKTSNCSSDFFQCANGNCVPAFAVCDGLRNCKDGSDEGCRKCPSMYFICDNGDCVPVTDKCNHVNDCLDNSDEQGCEFAVNCSSFAGLFQCDNGECIPESQVCDNYNECGDNSDEQHCMCASYQFQCENGQCIPQNEVCDRLDDCRDNSDEDSCDYCSADEFQCENSELCIPRSYVCDGVSQCGDGSDEDNCENCSSTAFKCGIKKCIPNYQVCNTFNDCGDNTDEHNCDQSDSEVGTSGVIIAVASSVAFLVLCGAVCIILSAACYYDKRKGQVRDVPPRPTVIAERAPLISDVCPPLNPIETSDINSNQDHLPQFHSNFAEDTESCPPYPLPKGGNR